MADINVPMSEPAIPRFSYSVAMMLMMYTPQPVMGIRMHTGEEVESRI